MSHKWHFFIEVEEMFKTKQDFMNYLGSQAKFSMKLSLERIKRACELLDNPQLKVKTLHVAGTNGKGSTCNYLSHLLMSSGYKVGLYISPFIITFNERIQINHEYISDEDLIQTANEIYPIILQVEEELQDDMTEFEVVTLLSYVYFYNQQVDYAVYEVGLGGRYDSTNVISPVVGGITNISYDHMGVLGNTLEEIGYEKVGIAKRDIKIFTTEENVSVLKVFADYTSKVKGHLETVSLDLVKNIEPFDEGIRFDYEPLNQTIELPMLGMHQVKNAILAIKMYQYVMEQNNLPLNQEVIDQGFKQSKWGGRLEIVSRNPFVMIDGSHNNDGVLKLVEAMRYYVERDYSIKIVFAALKDKETKKMLELLESISKELILTSFPFYRASKAFDLYDQIKKDGVSYNENYLDVLDHELNNFKPKEILLITGSLYFISEVKKYFADKKQ